LALFGPLAGEAAPALVQILNDSSQQPLSRLATIEALGRIGPARSEVLPAITSAVNTGINPGLADDPQVQERAIAGIEMLELFGGHAVSAVPSLIRATSSHSVRIRRGAANTLGM